MILSHRETNTECYLMRCQKMNLVIISLNPADEIFLSKEIKYLKDKFQIIFISRDREQYDNITIKSNEGVKSYVIDDPHTGRFNWLLHLGLSLFKPEVWDELHYLIRKKAFSFNTLRILLFYSASTAIDSKKIIHIMRMNNLSHEDKIFLYSYRMNTGALTIIKTKKYFNNVKCVARAHGVDLYEYRHENNYIPFRRKILKKLNTLYCISNDGEKYISQYPFEHCNVAVSRLGTADYGIEVAKAHTDSKSPPLFVSCSRISPEKRIEKIIDALALIDDEIKWLHIGGGDKIDDLKHYAQRKLKNKNNIKYEFAGNMSNDDVIEFYMKHFIEGFINVSSVEGIPVSIMEACSFGIPIIATNVGGTSEIVVDNYNGYLLPSDFGDELLASSISWFVKNKEQAKHLRKNARKQWENRFSEEHNYKLFADSLADV